VDRPRAHDVCVAAPEVLGRLHLELDEDLPFEDDVALVDVMGVESGMVPFEADDAKRAIVDRQRVVRLPRGADGAAKGEEVGEVGRHRFEGASHERRRSTHGPAPGAP
jgi:hypothetical protein